MWLRQVALVARALEPVVAQLRQVLGLEVAYRDPAVAAYGLVNAVLPVGGEFLEVVQPVTRDASAARYLARRAGDAGYMLILQAGDAAAHRGRLLADGVREIGRRDASDYAFTHFHPGDFAGVLTSIDSVPGVADWQDPDSDWPPAGPSWRDARRPSCTGLAGATIQARDPRAACLLWAERLALAPPAGDEAVLRVARGTVRFVPPADADGSGVVAVDLRVADRDGALDRARRCGVPADDGAVRICGTRMNLIG